jgi:hypothetical protein
VERIKSDKAALVQFFKTRDYTVFAYGMNLLCVSAPGAFPLKHNLAELCGHELNVDGGARCPWG